MPLKEQNIAANSDNSGKNDRILVIYRGGVGGDFLIRVRIFGFWSDFSALPGAIGTR